MKKVIFVGVFLSLAGFVLAQSGKRSLNDAFGAYSNAYYDKAKTAIDKCIEFDDTKADAKTWFYRGNIYLMIEAMKSTNDSARYKNLCDNCAEIAYDAYMQAGKIDPKVEVQSMNIKNIKEAMGYCADMLIRDVYRAMEKRDNESAYRLAKKAYSANSSDPDVIYYAGYASELVNKKEEAINYYSVLMKMKNNTNMYSYIRLASLYREDNDTAKTVKVMQDGAVVFLQNDTTFNVNYAEAYSIMMAWAGKTEEAAEVMDKALQKDPQNYVLLINYGSGLIANNHVDEAEVYFKRALGIKPDDAIANFNLGACYMKMYQNKSDALADIPIENTDLYDSEKKIADAILEQAKPYLEKAHELDPTDTQTLRTLRSLYARIKDGEKLYKEVEEKLNKLQGQ